LPSIPVTKRWLGHFLRVRLVGEAFNAVLPAGGMGGDPIKAALLKRHYGINYRDGIASVVLGKTANMLSLILFTAIAFALMFESDQLGRNYKILAAVGFAAFCLGTLLFYALQRYKWSSAIGSWLNRRGSTSGRKLAKPGRKLAEIIDHIHAVEDQFIHYYTAHTSRMGLTIILSAVAWLFGAVEIYIAFYFLGHPISLGDACIIEAVTQMVRAGTFFIPANLGAQEGAMVVISAALTGSPTLGVANAIIRRVRELIWILMGYAAGAHFSIAAARHDLEEIESGEPD